MASYIDSNLIKDERVVHRGHISLWSLSAYIAIGIVLTPAYGVGLIVLLVAYIKFKATELAVTNKRVIAKMGLVSRDTIEININKVESIQVSQSILGRVLNYGTLTINGTGSSHELIAGISDPLAFRRFFMEAQDQSLNRA